jgi:predicted O-methyltransferase YrrM
METSMTEQVKLYYGKWSKYNDPETNERKAELPVAFWFINKFEDDVIEIGEVTDFYIDARHTVYDLCTERPTTIKRDAFDVDYTGRNVLSISTVEHVGFGDYGQPKVPHQAIKLLKKMVSEAANYLISFPIGYNLELEQDMKDAGIDYSIIERSLTNHWTHVDHKDLSKYKYGSPQYAGNAIAIITNLDVHFTFENMKSEPIYLETDFQTIEDLKRESSWPLPYTSTVGLAPYIKRAGPDLVGVEIGTCRGESAYLLLEKCANLKKLYTIDPFTEFEDWNGTVPVDVLEKQKAIAIQNLKEWGDRIEMVFEKSENVASRFEDESLDFVYIDGDHSYEGVMKDLTLYYPKVKKGGYLAGHDFDTLGSVKRAVMEYRNNNRIRSPLHLTNNSSYFWVK